jgi:hypothetical protein
MQAGKLVEGKPEEGEPEAWKRFAIDKGTIHHYLIDRSTRDHRILRVLGGGPNGQTADGGYFERVDGLSHLETYRLRGKVRASWAVSDKHKAMIGWDPTGQTEDPKAATIHWTALPAAHGIFIESASEPIRPAEGSISIWLRGQALGKAEYAFTADFDDFSLRRIRTDPPGAGE